MVQGNRLLKTEEIRNYVKNNMSNDSAEEFFCRRRLDITNYRDSLIYEDFRGDNFLDEGLMRLAVKSIREDYKFVTNLDKNIIPDSNYIAIIGTAWKLIGLD